MARRDEQPALWAVDIVQAAMLAAHRGVDNNLYRKDMYAPRS